MAETQPSERDAEAQRARADRLEAELASVGDRLAGLEAGRATEAARLHDAERALRERRRDDELVVTRATAPLRGAERAVRWVFAKVRRVAGILARRIG